MMRVKMLICLLALLPLALPARAAEVELLDRTDPLDVGMAAADHELFGAVQTDLVSRPKFKVHHDLNWPDGTLMSGVAALYDRTEEQGVPAARYLDYLQEWARQRPGWPLPLVHGDLVCAGYNYIWLYDKLGRKTDHLQRTDGMLLFLRTGRKFTQYQFGYDGWWMRFWNDDTHMVPPFLALRGRVAGRQGMPGGEDPRAVAMKYCRAYAAVLQDPQTGLFWHDPRAVGDYQWGRGNGWVAAGYTKVIKALAGEPAYNADVEWLFAQLVAMAETLKDNRNIVGTWNADVLNRTEYSAPETSGSSMFVYMLAFLVNQNRLGPEYLPVVQKAWNFLSLSVTRNGEVMRVQPVGRGPITKDFEENSVSYGVGGMLLAASELSRLPQEALRDAPTVECARFAISEVPRKGGRIVVSRELMLGRAPGFEGATHAQAVVPGRRLPETRIEPGGEITIIGVAADNRAPLYVFFTP